MTEREHWNMAIDLVMESLWKPDAEMRNQAKDLGCYDDLMRVRESVLEHAKCLRRR